ncbi:MAG TPA: protein kinase [Methyloversatilis sp.]
MTEAPRRLGRYVLGREIGRGERGAVFEAAGTGGGMVAIKTFRTDMAEDARDYVRRLGERVLHVSQLQHPGIVRIIEQGVTAGDGTPWVAMERLDARSLRQLLDALPRMSFEWVRSIGLQAADALACAHASGVVHGGLKASNLLIDGAGHVTVTDFELPAPSPDALPAMPQYLSPEQVQGLAPDQRSDVFSLGAILFEMLAGRPPFGSPLTGSLSSVLENIAYAPTPTPSAIDPDVPPDLDLVVMKALAKSPVDRFGNAAELANALRQVRIQPSAPAPVPEKPARETHAAEDSSIQRRGKSQQPTAPVDDVLAALAADIDAFAARGAPEPSIGKPAAAPRPLREQGAPVAAFPTLHDAAPAHRSAQVQATVPGTSASVPAPGAAASSLLADLAGEAQRIRAHNAQMQRGELAARTGAEQALAARMQLVRDYFTQLAGQLNVIKPQVARDYPLLGLGVLRGLAWQASDVNTRNRGAEAPDQLVRVSLSYLLRGQALMRCERDPLAADSLRIALREHGLRFEEQPARDELNRLRAQVFDVAPEVRGRVELNADYRTLSLRLTLQNVERFGLVDYQPPAEDNGTEWLDELARLMLGQPSRFPTLARLIVPMPQ